MLIAARDFFVRNLNKGTFLWKVLEFLQGMFYVKNYLFYYKWNFIRSSTTTREINIEFISYCNLRCSFCSLDHEKPKVRITPELLDKFLKNLTDDKRFKKVEVIHLHNAGETLLHPEIGTLLEIIKKYKDLNHKKNQRFPTVHLLTNGTPLNEKKALEILDSKAVDVMEFSMDGGSPQRFEEMRIRAKWEQFYSNIKFFCDENKKRGSAIKTNIISVIDSKNPLKTDWMDKQFVEVLNMVDRYELRHPHTWAGEVNIEGDSSNNKNKPHKIGCGLLMHQLVLLPNGDVSVCCVDLNSKGVVGNINNDNLFDIYNSKLRRSWLELMFKRQKSQIDLCKNCDTF
ncbi:MAG: radical SAM protein [Flavobacteriales bacterium]|nr:radical SAM protein [Flavobacteriales bacterium]MBX2958537.1 radical SAM protein [Flavobacteriales bacterium]